MSSIAANPIAIANYFCFLLNARFISASMPMANAFFVGKIVQSVYSPSVKLVQ
jgi:hypothetical protein